MPKQVPTPGIHHDSRQIVEQIQNALTGEQIETALKKSVRILRQSSDYYDWVGIYLVKGDALELTAYAGDSGTEHVRIPIGQGICGSAAKEGHTILVPDVNRDPRYLACFASTRSEIVVPIIGKKAVLGEIDIDSDRPSAFNAEDQKSLEAVARKLAIALEN
ncbi:MAG TPA: GAF domain-containing protein [Candidatus Bathyarchaeia archaeon]|nr:GAF domain-containing protein [Candidatus Bathyarchaeia archaeon]